MANCLIKCPVCGEEYAEETYEHMKKHKKGRPPLEPRIAALEAIVIEQRNRIIALSEHLAPFDEMLYRVTKLELRFKEYRDGPPEGSKPMYESVFDKWPGNGNPKTPVSP
jgi:hypothetical protein